jgi:uncharacterized circularly permuted ATP-grasp superfamily protein/uncharacterized alpha-E superfamily protein
VPDQPLFAGYRPAPGHGDECLDAGGDVQAHWRELATHLERGGPAHLTRRWDEGRRLLRDNGLAFQVNAGAGDQRPWPLDPLPLVLSSDEWDVLAAGVAQRARLLDRVAADLNGARRLIADGLVPAGAVLPHPQCLRPCRGVVPPGGAHLLLYACDLVRGGDGCWRVLADWTQAPPGAGAALENRIVLARTLAEPFRAGRVQRLAPFFQAVRACLRALAPARERPRIALLTPGPGAETWFEQVYLARYLGLDVVQGDDLTMRDGRVLLKTLDGLQGVDVLLRRLGDEWCDPLELRGDSALGLPGMVEAVRGGGVALANPLGSGVVENPALLPFLGGVCRQLLGEQALLQPVALRWGAEAAAAARAEPARWLLRPAGANRGAGWHLDRLDDEERRRLEAELEARAHAWVAQEREPWSCAPAWDGGALVPRELVLRLFAVREGGGWQVMPGGLARTFAPGEAAQGWLGRGGGAKDVWVRARGEVADISLLPADGAAVELVRGGAALPSRVADHLFWLGRYAERAEDQARLLRAAVARLADDAELGGAAGPAAFLDLLRRFGQPVDEIDAAGDEARLLLLAGDPGACGFRGLQDALRRSGGAARDRCSADTWAALSALDRELGQADADPDANRILARLDRVVFTCAALAGMGRENTTRGPGWRFLDLGRRLERASFTAELLQGGLCDCPGAGSPALLEALLQVADSSITYRSRYRTALRAEAVLDLLLTDNTNPRSVGFQVRQMAEHVAKLPGGGRALPGPAQRLATRLQADVTLADPIALAHDAEALKALLASVAEACAGLSDAVTTAWLAHSAPVRTFLRDGMRDGLRAGRQGPP